MKIIAIVPARGGSKRLPGKNVKKLGGKPLIAWTIEAARKSQAVSDVVVSTDDAGIADIARKYGGTLLGLRPSYLATDTATSIDVVKQVLDQYEAANGPVQGVMLLQPTSPFRTTDSINRAISLFVADTSRAIVSVSASKAHPAWCFKITADAMEPFLDWDQLSKRSQDLEPAYSLNGSIYLIAPDVLRKRNSFVFPGTLPLLMEANFEALDIDTADDWDDALVALASLSA